MSLDLGKVIIFFRIVGFSYVSGDNVNDSIGLWRGLYEIRRVIVVLYGGSSKREWK